MRLAAPRGDCVHVDTSVHADLSETGLLIPVDDFALPIGFGTVRAGWSSTRSGRCWVRRLMESIHAEAGEADAVAHLPSELGATSSGQ